jgi:hypothetical protein
MSLIFEGLKGGLIAIGHIAFIGNGELRLASFFPLVRLEELCADSSSPLVWLTQAFVYGFGKYKELAQIHCKPFAAQSADIIVHLLIRAD